MTTTSDDTKRAGGSRVAVQRFGSFLSNMILPNIAAFIAWGIVTMSFLPAGFTRSKIAIIFSDDDAVQRLIAATTAGQLHALLSEVNES